MKITQILEAKKGVKAPKQVVKPRNYVAKNAMATTSGAGAHKDKKKAAKQGDVKHKKDLATESQDVAEEKQKGVDGKACWDGYKRMGTKQKGGKTVDNCVPMNEGFDPEYDDEAGMADNNLETLGRAVQGLDELISAGDNLPEWCQEKIAIANSMLVTVWDYMKSEEDVAEGKEDKIAQLKKDHATAVHWSKNETSPQKREAARQKAEKIKGHLEKQYKQGVAEDAEIVDQDSDLDQQVFTLNVDGKTVSFTYWDYENNFQTPDIKDIYQQAREQLGKKLSPEQIKAVARSVFKSFKSDVAESFGLYGPFTVTINTGTRPKSTTKTKKFRREDDAILWAQDWLEDAPQYVFATAQVTDPDGNVVWTTDEQGVAEGMYRRPGSPSAYDRDYASSVSGMGKHQSQAYQADGGANDEGWDEPSKQYQAPQDKPVLQGYYFYDVPAGKEQEASTYGIKQTKSGKWAKAKYSTSGRSFEMQKDMADKAFGPGKYWAPK